MYKHYHGFHGSGGGGAIGQGTSSCNNSRGGSPTSGYDNNDKESVQFSLNDLDVDADVDNYRYACI